MRALPICAPIPNLLLRPWRGRRPSSSSVSAFTTTATDGNDQSRGGLPRFYLRNLPSSKGSVIRVQDDEFWHMAKVLRLSVNDRVELFNGIGGLIEGCIQRIDKSGLDVLALEDLRVISPKKLQWHVFAAFGTLKGGRADWLVEKCTELGASSVTPILTKRSLTIAENRVDRLQRVSLAATKQCQRLHEMTLYPPLQFFDFLQKILIPGLEKLSLRAVKCVFLWATVGIKKGVYTSTGTTTTLGSYHSNAHACRSTSITH